MAQIISKSQKIHDDKRKICDNNQACIASILKSKTVCNFGCGPLVYMTLTCQLTRELKFSTINLYSVLVGGPYLLEARLKV